MGDCFRIFLFAYLFNHNIFMYLSIITCLPSQYGAVWLVISGDAHTVPMNRDSWPSEVCSCAGAPGLQIDMVFKIEQARPRRKKK